MDNLVQQVSNQVKVPEEIARRLLEQNNWDASQAVQAYRSRHSHSSRGRPAITTLGDLQRRDDPSKGPEKLFTGGEKSGLAVQNPGKGRGIIGDIIDKAMGNPVEERVPEHDPYRSSGFRLGTSSEASEKIGTTEQTPEHVTRTLTFWRNGFSIDDGPLYRNDDPRNEQYLREINSGRAPIDLLGVSPDQLVDLRLVQKLDEDYVAPKAQPGFHGEGQRLGGYVPGEVLRSPSVASTPEPEQTTQKSAPENSGSGDTLVQLRLANGSSRRVRVEGDGPVQQLYDLVGESEREYYLQTPFPPKKLDPSQTVRDAGIANAVVVQRWAS